MLTPAIQSWLLAVPYTFTAVGLMFIAWCTGGWVYPLLAPRNRFLPSADAGDLPGAGLLLLLVRVAAGMGIISWAAAWLGLLGWFTLWPMLTALMILVPGGLIVAARYGQMHRLALGRDWLAIGRSWALTPTVARPLAALVILVFCGLCVNAIIGALVPDMNQDPMWYHLPVPQQWVYLRRFVAFPDVMPSAYPLATEALYAVIFLVGGNEVLCSLLVALSGTCMMMAMAAGAQGCVYADDEAGNPGSGVLAVLGVWAPLLAWYGFLAPLQPKNEMVTMLWGYTGAVLIWLPPLATGRSARMGWWVVAGLLMGTACSAKPSMLSVTFFAWIWAAGVSGWLGLRGRNGGVAGVVKENGCFLLCMGAAMLPWMIRGWQTSGLPLYPLGRTWFKLNPAYGPLMAVFDQVNGFTGPHAGGWGAKLAAFPARLAYGASNGEQMIFLYMAVAALGVTGTRGIWRAYGAMLVCQLVLLVGINGAAEVFRFFSPAYCLATPLLAWLVARYAGALRPPVRLVVAALACFAVWRSTADHQLRAARFKTFDWKFRPVLAKEDVRQYAEHAEMGGLYLDFARIRVHILPDERVLLLGSTYPYYLFRQTVWNDEVVGKGGLKDRWGRMTAEEAVEFLRRERVDLILDRQMPGRTNETSGTVERLVEAGMARRVALPDEVTSHGWVLVRVGSDGGMR